MILSLGNNNAENIYKQIELESKFRFDTPIGEIKIFTRELPENDIFKKCDSNNILSKKEYPLLYSVIGDMYAGMLGRNLQEDELVIPNLEGRYLSMRTADGEFELSPDSIQAFALETVEYYAYFPNNNVSKNYFKSILDTVSKKYDMNRFEKPVKRIICDIKDHVRKTTSENDKAFLYYMRVR